MADVLPLALLPRLKRLDLSGNRGGGRAPAGRAALARAPSTCRATAWATPVRSATLSRLLWLDLTGNPVSDAAPARAADGAALRAVAGRGGAGTRIAGAAWPGSDAGAHRAARAGGDCAAALNGGGSRGGAAGNGIRAPARRFGGPGHSPGTGGIGGSGHRVGAVPPTASVHARAALRNPSMRIRRRARSRCDGPGLLSAEGRRIPPSSPLVHRRLSRRSLRK